MNELLKKLFQLGERANKNNNYTEALHYYNAVLVRSPSYEETLQRLAEMHYHGYGVKKSLLSVHAYLKQANSLLRTDSRLLGAHKLGDLVHGSAIYWEEQGDSFYGNNDRTLAAECYSLSLAASKEEGAEFSPSSLRSLAKIAVDEKDPLSAIRWIQKMDPSGADKNTYIKSVSYWRGLADACYEKKKYKEAVLHYNCALEVSTDEDSNEVAQIAGRLFTLYYSESFLEITGDMQNALSFYSFLTQGKEAAAVAEQKETLAIESYKKGSEACEQGELLQAVRYWQWAAYVNNHADAMFALGKLYNAQSFSKRSVLIASEWLRQAAERGSASAKNAQGNFAYWNGRFKEYFEGSDESKQNHTEALHCAEWELMHADNPQVRYQVFIKIAGIYENGSGGVKKSPSKALAHYMAAESVSSNIAELHAVSQHIKRVLSYETVVERVAKYGIPLATVSYYLYQKNYKKAGRTAALTATAIASEKVFGKNSWTHAFVQWAPFSASLGFKPHTILIHTLVSGVASRLTNKGLKGINYLDPYIQALGDYTGICDEEFKAAIRVSAHFGTQLLATMAADKVNQYVEDGMQKAVKKVLDRIKTAKGFSEELEKLEEPVVEEEIVEEAVVEEPLDKVPAVEMPKLKILKNAAKKHKERDYRFNSNGKEKHFRKGNLAYFYELLRLGCDVALYTAKTGQEYTLRIFPTKHAEHLHAGDKKGWKIDGKEIKNKDIPSYLARLAGGEPITMKNSTGKHVIVLYPSPKPIAISNIPPVISEPALAGVSSVPKISPIGPVIRGVGSTGVVIVPIAPATEKAPRLEKYLAVKNAVGKGMQGKLAPLTIKSKWEGMGMDYVAACDRASDAVVLPASTLLATQWAARSKAPVPAAKKRGERVSAEEPAWVATCPRQV